MNTTTAVKNNSNNIIVKPVLNSSVNPEIVNIDEEVHNNTDIDKIKRRSLIYPFFIIVAIALGVYSYEFSDNQDMSFSISFISFSLCAIGVLGLFIPRKVLSYMPTKEKLIRKQYYVNSSDKEFVSQHLKNGSLDIIKLLENEAAECAKNNSNGSTIKVIVYYTLSGSFISTQIHEYVPYEFIPKTPSYKFVNNIVPVKA